MLKNIFKLMVLGIILQPAITYACVDGDVAVMQLDRDYAGIASLPIASYLGLDDSCNGRHLNSIVMTASSSAGPGMATLIVNGIPVGPTQTIGAVVAPYEFKLDPIENVLGQDIQTMEIRLSGDFHIASLQANLADVPPPWSDWGTLLGTTPLIGCNDVTTTILVPADAGPYSRVLFVARESDFYVEGVTVNFVDGSQSMYGSVTIPKDQARRVDNDDCNPMSSIVIVGHGSNCHKAKLEVRAMDVENR